MASNLSSEEILSALEELSPAELEGLVPRIIALGAARRAPHLSLTDADSDTPARPQSEGTTAAI